jgi:hypothetical protein
MYGRFALCPPAGPLERLAVPAKVDALRPLELRKKMLDKLRRQGTCRRESLSPGKDCPCRAAERAAAQIERSGRAARTFDPLESQARNRRVALRMSEDRFRMSFSSGQNGGADLRG